MIAKIHIPMKIVEWNDFFGFVKLKLFRRCKRTTFAIFNQLCLHEFYFFLNGKSNARRTNLCRIALNDTKYLFIQALAQYLFKLAQICFVQFYQNQFFFSSWDILPMNY